MAPRPIRRIAVAGPGIVARSAAAALRRRLPGVEVVLVPSAPDPAALADTMAPALPSIAGFHADLGIGDDDAVRRTASIARLGTLHCGWAEGHGDYLHAYGPCGDAIGGAPFHAQWARLADPPAFEQFCAAAGLARAGRMPPQPAPPPLAEIEPGLTLDLPRYTVMLDAFAAHCGVRRAPAPLARVVRAADDMIAELVLADGSTVSADLFVDATGPGAVLAGADRPDRQDWSHWPGCDRLIRVEGLPPPALRLYDTVRAVAAGWLWHAATPARSSHGLCYASAWCSDEAAARLLTEASGLPAQSPPVVLRRGMLRHPWRGNCVAIGDAAVAMEPLEWTGLHLAHSAIDRIVTMLPDAECAAVELAEYNRQARAEAERARDFAMLHYAAARRHGDFWRHAAHAPIPDSLAHSLRLFRDRGRLPTYPEETFARDSWLAVLIGQGERPARTDPLAATTPVAAIAGPIHAIGRAIAAAVATAPPHPALRAEPAGALA